jgi:predicted DNA-binding transcriptional regulator AlpA
MEDYMRNDPERVMRPAEIAEFLGLGTRQVQRMFADRTLAKIKLGKRACGARRGDVIALVKGGDDAAR